MRPLVCTEMGCTWGRAMAVHAAKERAGGRSATCGVSAFHSSKAQFRAGSPGEQPGIISWEESGRLGVSKQRHRARKSLLAHGIERASVQEL